MPLVTSLPDLYVASDSSGSYGFGAVCGNAWFYGGWPYDLSPTSITVLELFPIVVAAHGYASKSNSCVIIRQSWPS